MIARRGWAFVGPPVPGLADVDQVFDQLVTDLQHELFATSLRGVRLAVPVFARERLAAVRLARAAIEEHEHPAKLRLATLKGSRLVDRFSCVVKELGELLQWVPTARRQHLFQQPGAVTPTDIVSQLELPNLAYLVVTAKRFDGAERAARRYAQLLDEVTECDREHRRRFSGDRPTVTALAVFVLVTGLWPDEEPRALKELDTMLPLGSIRRGRYGGDETTRAEDWPQQLRLHALEIMRELGRSEQDLLARLYDRDPTVSYIPNAATRDFLNARAKGQKDIMASAPGRRQTTLEPAQEGKFRAWYQRRAEQAGLDPNPDASTHRYDYRAAFLAGAEPQIDPADGTYQWPSQFKIRARPRRVTPDTETQDMEALLSEGVWRPGEALPPQAGEEGRTRAEAENVALASVHAAQLRDRILALFPHTPLERQILDRFLLNHAVDPRDHGYQSALADAVGCSREKVNRYFAEAAERLRSLSISQS